MNAIPEWASYYPLLAHPERYEYMRLSDYKALKEEYISFQLNVPSLAGMYDRAWNDTHSMKFYQYLLESTFRHKVATALAGCK